MTYADTLRYLYNLKNRGIKLTLDRVYRFQEALEYPDREYDCIHIAGTNGKGSVCHFLATLLEETGAKVGLYTSPHLVRFNERVRVNGAMIPDEFIKRFITRWRELIDNLHLTYFETTTLMAMEYFRDRSVDIAVLETGLGGRLDATNIVRPLVTGITSIGLEHSEQLGESLAEIAGEKAGIIKDGVPCVVGAVPAEALEVIRQKTGEQGSLLLEVLQEYPVESVHITQDGTRFGVPGMDDNVRLSMIGDQAAVNAMLAVGILSVQDRYRHLWEEQRAALQRVTIPGRLQRMQDAPLIYYDVAHNYDSLNTLLQNLEILFPQASMRFLLAMGEIKEIRPLRDLFGADQPLGIMQTADMPMHDEASWRAQLPEHQFQNYGPGPLAVQRFSTSLAPDEIGIIAGSHYIATDVYRAFNFSLDT